MKNRIAGIFDERKKKKWGLIISSATHSGAHGGESGSRAKPIQRLQPKSVKVVLFFYMKDGAKRLINFRTARECASMFQRSSSCVEGGNAQLSLHHHGLHGLSDGKLGALTVIHNFDIKRADGSTVAERVFGSKPKRSLWVAARQYGFSSQATEAHGSGFLRLLAEDMIKPFYGYDHLLLWADNKLKPASIVFARTLNFTKPREKQS